MHYNPGDRIEWVTFWVTLKGVVQSVVREPDGSIKGYKVVPDGSHDVVFIPEDVVVAHKDKYQMDPKDLMSDYDRAMKGLI